MMLRTDAMGLALRLLLLIWLITPLSTSCAQRLRHGWEVGEEFAYRVTYVNPNLPPDIPPIPADIWHYRVLDERDGQFVVVMTEIEALSKVSRWRVHLVSDRGVVRQTATDGLLAGYGLQFAVPFPKQRARAGKVHEHHLEGTGCTLHTELLKKERGQSRDHLRLRLRRMGVWPIAQWGDNPMISDDVTFNRKTRRTIAWKPPESVGFHGELVPDEELQKWSEIARKSTRPIDEYVAHLRLMQSEFDAEAHEIARRALVEHRRRLAPIFLAKIVPEELPIVQALDRLYLPRSLRPITCEVPEEFQSAELDSIWDQLAVEGQWTLIQFVNKGCQSYHMVSPCSDPDLVSDKGLKVRLVVEDWVQSIANGVAKCAPSVDVVNWGSIQGLSRLTEEGVLPRATTVLLSPTGTLHGVVPTQAYHAPRTPPGTPAMPPPRRPHRGYLMGSVLQQWLAVARK